MDENSLAICFVQIRSEQLKLGFLPEPKRHHADDLQAASCLCPPHSSSWHFIVMVPAVKVNTSPVGAVEVPAALVTLILAIGVVLLTTLTSLAALVVVAAFVVELELSITLLALAPALLLTALLALEAALELELPLPLSEPLPPTTKSTHDS